MMVGLTFLGYHNDEHFDNKTVLGFAMSVMISPLRTELPVLPPRKRGNIQNVRLIQLHTTFMKVKRNDGHFFICIFRFTIRPIFCIYLLSLSKLTIITHVDPDRENVSKIF